MIRRQSIASLLLLALVVAAGITFCCSIVVLWGATVADQTAPTGPIEQLQMRADGQPVILRYVNRWSSFSQQIVSLDGEVLTEGMEHVTPPTYTQPPSSPFLATSRLAGTGDYTTSTYWYLVHDGRINGRAYGVGYYSASKQVAGYFGRRGFTAEKPPREDWFQVAGDTQLAFATPVTLTTEPFYHIDPVLPLLADGQVWSIDVRRREVKPLLESSTAYTIGWASQTLDKLPDDVPIATPVLATYVQPQIALPRKLIARGPDRITICDPQASRQTVIPIPERMRKQQLACYLLAEGATLLVSADDVQTEINLAWLNDEGELQRERQLRLTGTRGLANSVVFSAWTAAAAMPLPLGSAVFTAAVAESRVTSGKSDTLTQALVETLAATWPTVVALGALGGVLAAATWRRQQRFALPHAALWSVFVLVFGVPGYLAYRFHRTWPVLEPCPRCNERSPRDRDRCADCGATFPPPELKGIEVFE